MTGVQTCALPIYKVVTNGGIHGTISGIEEKTVLLDIGNNVKMKIERTAIGQVVQAKK